jgi:hypothetical protein
MQYVDFFTDISSNQISEPDTLDNLGNVNSFINLKPFYFESNINMKGETKKLAGAPSEIEKLSINGEGILHLKNLYLYQITINFRGKIIMTNCRISSEVLEVINNDEDIEIVFHHCQCEDIKIISKHRLVFHGSSFIGELTCSNLNTYHSYFNLTTSLTLKKVFSSHTYFSCNETLFENVDDIEIVLSNFNIPRLFNKEPIRILLSNNHATINDHNDTDYVFSLEEEGIVKIIDLPKPKEKGKLYTVRNNTSTSVIVVKENINDKNLHRVYAHRTAQYIYMGNNQWTVIDG